jgi:hypothetical protein
MAANSASLSAPLECNWASFSSRSTGSAPAGSVPGVAAPGAPGASPPVPAGGAAPWARIASTSTPLGLEHAEDLLAHPGVVAGVDHRRPAHPAEPSEHGRDALRRIATALAAHRRRQRIRIGLVGLPADRHLGPVHDPIGGVGPIDRDRKHRARPPPATRRGIAGKVCALGRDAVTLDDAGHRAFPRSARRDGLAELGPEIGARDHVRGAPHGIRIFLICPSAFLACLATKRCPSKSATIHLQ